MKNCTDTLEESLKFLTEINMVFYKTSSNSPWNLCKEVKNLNPNINLHLKTYSSLIHNCQILETTKWYLST